jgi:two-component system OmpR family response regulator
MESVTMTEPLPHILVVDDHRDVREPLAKYLARNDYRVSVAEDAAVARQVLARQAIDLVVLDVMMPGEDGLALCRHLRESSDLPIIMLTARVEHVDRVVGLEMGADDYVTKPFEPRELLARIKAVLRRAHSLPPSRQPEAGTLRFAGWSLDVDRRELTGRDGVAVALSRDQLLDHTRGRDAGAFDRSIDNQVSRLRRKIEVDPKDPKLITTVWGGGYILAADVERS